MEVGEIRPLAVLPPWFHHDHLDHQEEGKKQEARRNGLISGGDTGHPRSAVLGGPEDQSFGGYLEERSRRKRVDDRPQRGIDMIRPEFRDASVDMELNVTTRDDPNLVLEYKLSMQSFRQAGPRGSSHLASWLISLDLPDDPT